MGVGHIARFHQLVLHASAASVGNDEMAFFGPCRELWAKFGGVCACSEQYRAALPAAAIGAMHGSLIDAAHAAGLAPNAWARVVQKPFSCVRRIHHAVASHPQRSIQARAQYRLQCGQLTGCDKLARHLVRVQVEAFLLSRVHFLRIGRNPKRAAVGVIRGAALRRHYRSPFPPITER